MIRDYNLDNFDVYAKRLIGERVELTMKIRNLETYYWIATLGSFRAASEKLNLTQPAITARIHVLEQDLGAAVFSREVKSAELTPVGRKLLPYAAKLMTLDQDVLAAFADVSTINQTIRLGASETIVSTWLPDFLEELNKTNKPLSFDLSVDATNNLRNALVNREIDLAFLMGPVAEASIANYDICAFEMIFAAIPDIANQNEVWSLNEIAKQQVLTFANNTKPSRQIRELLSPYNSGAVDMTTSTSLGALIRLALVGFGICAVPKAVIQTELQSGKMVELKTNFKLPSIFFTASYVSESPISDFLSSVCKDLTEFMADRVIKNIYQT